MLLIPASREITSSIICLYLTIQISELKPVKKNSELKNQEGYKEMRQQLTWQRIYSNRSETRNRAQAAWIKNLCQPEEMFQAISRGNC
jgi:hypothetical protein